MKQVVAILLALILFLPGQVLADEKIRGKYEVIGDIKKLKGIKTIKIGIERASKSFYTFSDVCKCSSIFLLASITWISKSASLIVDNVDRNAATNSCGRLLIKPTVSESKTLGRESSCKSLVVESSVANK